MHYTKDRTSPPPRRKNHEIRLKTWDIVSLNSHCFLVCFLTFVVLQELPIFVGKHFRRLLLKCKKRKKYIQQTGRTSSCLLLVDIGAHQDSQQQLLMYFQKLRVRTWEANCNAVKSHHLQWFYDSWHPYIYSLWLILYSCKWLPKIQASEELRPQFQLRYKLVRQ